MILLRFFYSNHIYTPEFKNAFENGGMKGHVDIPRLEEGKVGGSFWSAFVPCPANGSDFSDESYAPCKYTYPDRASSSVAKRVQSSKPLWNNSISSTDSQHNTPSTLLHLQLAWPQSTPSNPATLSPLSELKDYTKLATPSALFVFSTSLVCVTRP